MRETKDKCWCVRSTAKGAGCVNYASPVLRGCGNSMEMEQADRKPTAETLGHYEIGCLLKLKNPIYSPEAGLARLLKWMINRPGSVITDVIRQNQMLQYLRTLLENARKKRLRRIMQPGKILTRFVARDVRRDVEIVSVDELDNGFITARIRTINLLYLPHGLPGPEDFSEPERIALNKLWKWTGHSWGGLPDGTSIADASLSDGEDPRNTT